MSSAGRRVSRLSWLTRIAVALVLAAATACGSQDDSKLAAVPAPAVSPTVAEPATSAPASSAPETQSTAEVPSGSAPAVSIPSVSVPSTSIPSVSVPSVSVPSVSVPSTSIPSVSVPSVSVPSTSIPSVSVPSGSAPAVSIPSVSVPSVSVPSVSLPVAAEYDAGYDRDGWGPHNSGICRGAVGSSDPYTGTPIDTCNVDHVVALHEAHESGGWAWPADAKQRFSRDPDNHVASRACVNQVQGR